LVDAYCLAFAASTRLDYLHMARTEGGHSMHAFGQAEHNMGAIDVVFRQSTIGITVDRFCELYAPRPPAHIKLDVDSIELAILEGAQKTLATHVRSLMVEVQGTNQTSGGSPIADFLGPLGFLEDRAFMAQGARRNVLFRR
jgi:FkbM family methyltransferase